MADPYVGEIRMFGGTFAPLGWAFCDGSLLSIAENSTLFALIGTTYGGDGQTTFALPDLRGRVPIAAGTGPGLTPRTIGEAGGSETVTLTTANLPPHGHPAGDSEETTNRAPGAALARGGSYAPGPPTGATVGGNQPHENRSPYLAVSFIIALFGIFPSQ